MEVALGRRPPATRRARRPPGLVDSVGKSMSTSRGRRALVENALHPPILSSRRRDRYTGRPKGRPLTPVTLMTDFGTRDGYVAEMKGVLLERAPGIPLIDITHDIPPHDIDTARQVLARYWQRFPRGTVHLVVVDPGVGTARRALAVASEGRFLVGPDNGVLSPALALDGATAVALHVPADASATFHGRDVFAPAAAALASGRPIASLGVPCPDPILTAVPALVPAPGGRLEGEVVAIDRFGNAVTNLPAPDGDATAEWAGRRLPVRRTYSDVERGEVVALVGSSGHIEIAVREGSAAAVLGIARGARVVLGP